MKLIVAISLVALLDCSITCAQLRRGSIAVIYYRTSDKIIVAADSRGSIGGEKAISDNECKIAALGNRLVYVNTGFGGYDPIDPRDPIKSWRPIDDARTAYWQVIGEKAAKPPKELIWDVAARWAEIVSKHLDAHLMTPYPDVVLKSLENGVATSAFFAEAVRERGLKVIRVQIKLSAEGKFIMDKPWEIPAGGCPPCAQGKKEIVDEIYAGNSPRVKKEHETWRKRTAKLSRSTRERLLVIDLVKLTILWHPQQASVGGPIDALELTRYGGVTWLQRKEKCRAN